MKSFEFDAWDDGRLTVNRDWARVLQSHGLTTFDSLMHQSGGTVAKNLLRERTTTRFELSDDDGKTHGFYIKRHSRPPLKEYIKPWLRLRTPIFGARGEWEAMLRFHAAGIPTMVPVCLGERGSSSFVVTEAIEGHNKLSHWMEAAFQSNGSADRTKIENVIQRIATIAGMMHRAGMHHQDFYLTHLLLPPDESADGIRVIDLGRVRVRRRLATRWIVKDLAQLNYSAPFVTQSDRQRFLEAYLGRPLNDGDRRFVRKIARKSNAIARHSHKHSL